ncbi:MAG: polysaccharide deacetylase [Firmicutes bacterium HGW-Firmicutes-12]|jgi:peptidoglycan/xylan/chitin deacetylase (PgdA/CDA1 family)|nr:MAG: polysaccharide deacetylase [Firmicutes bacterium HGW-Firmicutes-12]
MFRKMNVIIVVILLLVLFITTGCATKKYVPAEIEKAKPPIIHEKIDEIKLPKIDLATIKANEAGQVMILMYHVIGAEKEKDWIQTTENFRRDLLTLYNEGYTLIDLNDFVNNNISVPAGRTPVVLTFDDASIGQFRYIIAEDGTKTIDPECAAGILLDFADKYPELGYTATFYMNAEPFGQREYWKEKLQEMISLGFAIGNHSLTHPKLNKLTSERVQKELAELAKLVEEAVPGYKVRSLALPFGISPEERSLAAEGSFQGYSYTHNAILKVGANPAISPISKDYDPLYLPRVQASSVELEKWFEYFRKHPEKRYISDGDSTTIAVPKEQSDTVDRQKIGDKELIIY